MATATGIINRNLRGAVGDLIFRNYNGKTVVSVRPVYKNETNTPARKQARGRFRDATDFASNAMESIKMKLYYTQKARQLKLPNAYTAAITDYLRKAKVKVFTRSAFAPKKGTVVNIMFHKRAFRTGGTKAILCNQNGDILTEQSLAVVDAEHNHFQFTLADDFPDCAFLKIITDEPGDKSHIVEVSEFLAI